VGKRVPLLRKIVVAVGVLVIWMSTSAVADSVQKSPNRKSRGKKSEQAQVPPYTPHTLSPLPLEQMPAVPPQVAYSGGMLTIEAHNSTLGDILRAVHSQTGADLDVPPNATERVVATLGPGPARDVLATLLNGTHFNYVMLGVPGDPSAVERVVLTTKTGPETQTTASAAPVPPQGTPPNRFQQPMMVPQPQNADPDASTDDNSADAPDDNAENPEDQGDQQQNQGQAPKTPEQLLQELQRQQQQLQQQQQGQPGQPVQPGQPQIVYPNPTQPAPDSQN
jgi:hypothetical protein